MLLRPLRREALALMSGAEKILRDVKARPSPFDTRTHARTHARTNINNYNHGHTCYQDGSSVSSESGNLARLRSSSPSAWTALLLRWSKVHLDISRTSGQPRSMRQEGDNNNSLPE